MSQIKQAMRPVLNVYINRLDELWCLSPVWVIEAPVKKDMIGLHIEVMYDDNHRQHGLKYEEVIWV